MFKRKLDAEPVVHNLKDYDVVIDYCACMVAIILATHVVDASNVNVQWSASQLALILNNSPRGTNTNYYINVAALSHGFLLFRKDLKRKGLSLIEIYQEEKLVPCYYGLKYSRMSLEIKFSAYFTPHVVENDLLSCILLQRNEILKKNKYETSPYSSPSLVFGVMQLELNLNRSTVETGTNTIATSANLRKSPSDLSDRSVKNVTTKVITSVEGVVGEKNSLYFLKSAVKILDFKQRKMNNMEREVDEEGSSEDEEEENSTGQYIEHEEYRNDARMKMALSNIPNKNITYTTEDIKNVLEVFDVVKVLVSERNTDKINSKSAACTVEMLIENTYYSQLTVRTVLRWSETREKINAKPGRKIDNNFESEVWGKLMLCVFERNSENVSYLVAKYFLHLNKYIHYGTYMYSNVRT